MLIDQGLPLIFIGKKDLFIKEDFLFLLFIELIQILS